MIINTYEELAAYPTDPIGITGPIVLDFHGDVFELNDDHSWAKMQDSGRFQDSDLALPATAVWRREGSL